MQGIAKHDFNIFMKNVMIIKMNMRETIEFYNKLMKGFDFVDEKRTMNIYIYIHT